MVVVGLPGIRERHPRPFGWDLAAHGDRVAVVTDSGEVSYRRLASLVAAAASRLGDGRRLVLVAGSNDLDAVVAYLAAQAAGHVVLLAPASAVEPMTARYDPDVVVRSGRYEQRRAGSTHVLHPDLALLLTTSGSTGSPKLVRLSYANVRANADQIARYLDIRPTDRAATTLPMHYCYGLSVIHSHLARGAGLILTGLSVTDACFWDLFRRAGGTAFAGVPHTFALLDRIGFDAMRLPALRYVTQAGGRLPADRVRHYAGLGRERGWDLFVMYGQTEATARMAYLPPDLAAEHPTAIGVAVPDGELRLDPDSGELVYRGPNVMLGYADNRDDLALGRTIDELRTGDLARRTDDGLFEIVGRLSRFVKVFGLRIDLDGVEEWLAGRGVTASCVGVDDDLVVAVEGTADGVQRPVAEKCGLPTRCVRVVAVPALPRLPSGKPDRRPVAALARRPSTEDTQDRRTTDLCALYAEVLDRPQVTPDDTFTGLGGDSLSYAEMSVRLEQVLGRVPTGWHTTKIRDLRPEPTRWRRIDTSVVLRAVSIVIVVGSHIGIFAVRGGAAILLAVAGFNFARFHLAVAERTERVKRIAATVARIAVPSMVFIAGVTVLTDAYDWRNPLLLNEALGTRYGSERHFWFLETLVYILLAVMAVLAVPAVHRWEARRPFGFAVAVLGLAATVRFEVVELDRADNLTTPAVWMWLFALGWVIGRASGTRYRWLVTVAVLAFVVGHSGDGLRVAVVTVGLLALVWVPYVPATAVVHRLTAILAGGSLYVYLTHWQVYPHIAPHSMWLALLASLAVGVAFGHAVERITALIRRRFHENENRARTAPRRRPGRLWKRRRGTGGEGRRQHHHLQWTD